LGKPLLVLHPLW